MDIKKAKLMPPNMILIECPIKNYSPIDVVNFHINQLDRSVKTYFVLNTTLKIMHKVTINPTHIESVEVVL
jgi:hypothetical protein